MIRVIAILVLILTAVSAQAQDFKYRCYVGSLSNSVIKDITKVRIGLADDNHHKVSFVVFYSHGSKYSTDLFCAKNHIGRCNLLDDSGSFEILKLTTHKMTIQFDGVPQLVKKQGEILPMIDSRKLKTPIKMSLTAHPKSDCSY